MTYDLFCRAARQDVLQTDSPVRADHDTRRQMSKGGLLLGRAGLPPGLELLARTAGLDAGWLNALASLASEQDQGNANRHRANAPQFREGQGLCEHQLPEDKGGEESDHPFDNADQGYQQPLKG